MQVEFGAARLRAIGGVLCDPAVENLLVLGHAGAIVVFNFVVDGHGGLQKSRGKSGTWRRGMQGAARNDMAAKPGYFLAHENRRKTHTHHLGGSGRQKRRHHRPDAAAAPLRQGAIEDAGRRRPRHQVDAGARRAADRRHCRLRRLAGAAGGRLRRRARPRLCDADRDAADRDQPEMGARRDDGGGAQPAARRAAGSRLLPRRRDRRRGRRDQPGHRPQRAQAHRGHRRQEEERRARQRAHPLQCRLARHRRLGHRHRADLHGARQGHAGACVRRRDAAAQPGRFAHRLGAQPPRRAAHRHSRQHRRPSDAARHGRSRHRRHRPRHRAGRRLQQDRHLFEGAGRPRQQRAVLRGAAVADHRLHRQRRASPKSRSSSARATRSR